MVTTVEEKNILATALLYLQAWGGRRKVLKYDFYLKDTKYAAGLQLSFSKKPVFLEVQMGGKLFALCSHLKMIPNF